MNTIMFGSILKIFSREKASKTANSAARRHASAYVIREDVANEIRAVAGVSVGTFLRACEEHAVPIPGVVQCPALRNVTLWLADQGYEYDAILDMPLRDVRDRAVNLEV